MEASSYLAVIKVVGTGGGGTNAVSRMVDAGLKGVEFLLASARSDGSWPVDTNLATWHTSLAVRALASNSPVETNADGLTEWDEQKQLASLDWLLACQHTDPHPMTGAVPGGWAWTDRSGGVPDVDDTSAALLALWTLLDTLTDDALSGRKATIIEAARNGVEWLLGVQNTDGGWPTFCSGWQKLPFDRSSADITAHALRAVSAWRGSAKGRLLRGMDRAVSAGLAYLEANQRSDGSWLPLWFGNENAPNEENPVYGTSRVLAAYRDLNLLSSSAATQGIEFLCRAQNPDGSWGGAPNVPGSIEETALACDALSGFDGENAAEAFDKGLAWLCKRIAAAGFSEPTPIGLYFAKLWYFEKLYPMIFSVSALRRALARVRSRTA